MSFTDPVQDGAFFVAADTFFVKTSCGHIHSRATSWEINAVFYHTPLPSELEKLPDPPGHWYEAQLLHYGISHTKTKSVAKVRLLDAFNAGNRHLTVPKEIEDIEDKLTKKWRKKDKPRKKAAKEEFKESNSTEKKKSAKSANASTKRRRSDHEDNVEKTPQSAKRKKRGKDNDEACDVSRTRNEKKAERKLSSAAKDHEDKDPKLTPNAAKRKPIEDEPDTEAHSLEPYRNRDTPEKSKTARELSDSESSDTGTDETSNTSNGLLLAVSTSNSNLPTCNSNMDTPGSSATSKIPTAPRRMIQEAARRESSTTERQPFSNIQANPAVHTPTKPSNVEHTARYCNGGASIGSRHSSTKGKAYETGCYPNQLDSDIEQSSVQGERQSYVGLPMQSPKFISSPEYEPPQDLSLCQASHQSESTSSYPTHSISTGPSMGRVNGMYEVECPFLARKELPARHRFSLILAATRNSAWAAYYFGRHHGIMYVPERPTLTNEKYPFYWRGRGGHDGQMSFGPRNMGWMRFLGGGKIEGMLNCDGEPTFHGELLPNQDRRLPRSVNSMKHEWDVYNEKQFERERRARREW